jgi:hypothetical protein
MRSIYDIFGKLIDLMRDGLCMQMEEISENIMAMNCMLLTGANPRVLLTQLMAAFAMKISGERKGLHGRLLRP